MKIGVISGLIVQAHSVCVLPDSPHRTTSAGNRTATTTADAHRASRRSLAKGLRLRTLRPMDSSGTSLVRARRGDPRRGASRRGASRPVLLPRSARLSMLIWLAGYRRDVGSAACGAVSVAGAGFSGAAVLEPRSSRPAARSTCEAPQKAARHRTPGRKRPARVDPVRRGLAGARRPADRDGPRRSGSACDAATGGPRSALLVGTAFRPARLVLRAVAVRCRRWRPSGHLIAGFTRRPPFGVPDGKQAYLGPKESP